MTKEQRAAAKRYRQSAKGKASQKARDKRYLLTAKGKTKAQRWLSKPDNRQKSVSWKKIWYDTSGREALAWNRERKLHG